MMSGMEDYMKKFLSILLIAVMAVSVFSLPTSAATSNTERVSAAKLSTKKYDWYTVITLKNSEGAVTYYTLDGTTPSKDNGYKYDKPFSVAGKATLRFRTYKSGYKSSKVTKYTVKDLIDGRMNIDVSEKSFKRYINALPLNPQKTNNSYIDKQIKNIFDDIFEKDMTTYEKMEACYDWITKNIKYGKNGPYVLDYNMNGYNTAAAYCSTMYAESTLKNKKGVCDSYSALYYIMLRRIGIDDACWLSGKCLTTSGGYTGHMWTGIDIGNGAVVRYYDAMLDRNSSSGRQYFGRTVSNSTKLFKKEYTFDYVEFDNFSR